MPRSSTPVTPAVSMAARSMGASSASAQASVIVASADSRVAAYSASHGSPVAGLISRCPSSMPQMRSGLYYEERAEERQSMSRKLSQKL